MRWDSFINLIHIEHFSGFWLIIMILQIDWSYPNCFARTIVAHENNSTILFFIVEEPLHFRTSMISSTRIQNPLFIRVRSYRHTNQCKFWQVTSILNYVSKATFPSHFSSILGNHSSNTHSSLPSLAPICDFLLLLLLYTPLLQYSHAPFGLFF